ncbi:hypothetical protein [Streptomyces cinereospinus]|uniref:Transposase n=1 Tax=Streptomyces cinereospinus TaxID=285561 RepID=A0ABV5N668_9ACTN
MDDDLWALIEPLLPPWPEKAPGPRPRALPLPLLLPLPLPTGPGVPYRHILSS